MTDELFSLRVVVASGSKDDRDLLRQAAAASKVPIETIEAEDAASACGSLARAVDLVFLDDALGSSEVARVAAAARAAPKTPFTVLLAGSQTEPPFETDALAVKPADIEEAKRFVSGAIRVRRPIRVLVVDDSSTMRSIVRKTLAATRFPLDVIEAAQGIDAIELARTAEFDLVLVDYNMPGFNGLETMAEFRREKRRVTLVLISSTQDRELVERARAQGAGFLQKPFFPADIETVLSTDCARLVPSGRESRARYCRDSSTENSPLRMRAPRFSA
jgi:CheY-like chemotaxis protein